MTDFYAQGREANRQTVDAILEILERHYKNYIPESERARNEYFKIISEEYKRYMSEKTKDNK
jgi:hypothetical protein